MMAQHPHDGVDGARTPIAKARPRRRWLRRIVLSALLVVLFVIVWWGIGRLAAPGRAVRIIDAQSAQASAPTEHDTARTTLRIATWNIAHGRGLSEDTFNSESDAARLDRLHAIADQLRAHDLDIVILNEVDFDATWSSNINQAAIIAQRSGYNWRVEQRNVDTSVPFFALRFGNVILSRVPIRAAVLLDFPWHSRFESIVAGGKKGVVATLEFDDDMLIRVAAMHLDHRWGGQSTRMEAARMLRRHATDGGPPLILGGDFNTSLPGFPGVRARRVSETALSILLEDDLFQTSPMADPGPDDFTFRANDPTRVIDWILIPRSWTLLSREVLSTDLADHRMVIVEVERTP
ncbi:MAG: endonuclease/exonuclease/phosphatase family protein [Phycisphaerales bacterium]